MKQKILSIFAFCSLLATQAQAQTTVPIIWPFAPGSTQGQMVREIVQEANAIQKKYVFVMETRSGAGGAVAVQHALSQKTPVVIAHTNSYWTRPLFSSEGTYDTELFRLVHAYCIDQPIAVLAKNFNSLTDLDKKGTASIGVIPGSITQLVSQQLIQQRPRIQFTEAGFKDTPSITVNLLGDHLDLSVDWLAGVNDDRIKVLGITGTVNVGNARTFRSQGLSGFENLTNSYYLFINKSMDPALSTDLVAVLARASQNARVQEFCRKDFGQPVDITGPQAQRLADERRDFWTKQVKSVKR